MKFFEAVPDELFSGRWRHRTCAVRGCARCAVHGVPRKAEAAEDMLYSMLRSRLEQQLAEATFEGRGHRRG